MEFKTISDIENPLFNRREVEGGVHSRVTPSRQEVSKVLSEKLSVPIGNIKIRTIIGKFGSRIFVVNANIYSSKEERDRIEIKKKKDAEAEREVEEAAKASGETSIETQKEEAKESPAEEKPAETPTEEPKIEEKPTEENKEGEKNR